MIQLFWGVYTFQFGRYIEACVCVCAHGQALSHVLPFATPWTVACQVPLSIRFPRQEYWSRLPFPSPWDLPEPGIEASLLCLLHWQEYSLPLHHLGVPIEVELIYNIVFVSGLQDSDSVTHTHSHIYLFLFRLLPLWLL